MVLNAIKEERKEQKARAYMRTFGAEIVDYEAYKQRKLEEMIKSFIYNFSVSVLLIVYGMVLMLVLVARAVVEIGALN